LEPAAKKRATLHGMRARLTGTLNYISTQTCSRIMCHSTRTRLRVFSSIPQLIYRFRDRAAMAVCFFGFFFGTFKE